MEKPLSNTCAYSVEHLTEALRIQTRNQRKWQNWLLMGLLLLLFGYSMYIWLKNGESRYLLFAILSVVMGALLGWTVLQAPKTAARAQAAKLREHNGSLEFHTQFLEDGVAFLDPQGQETTRVPYGDFEELVTTEHLILLFTRDRKMILLDPARIENGAEADLRALLRERCPRLKIR